MKKTLLTLFLATVLAVVVVGTPMGGGKCETSSDCVAPNGKIPFLLHYTIGQKSSNYPKTRKKSRKTEEVHSLS